MALRGVVGTYPLVKGFCWYVILCIYGELLKPSSWNQKFDRWCDLPSVSLHARNFWAKSLSILFFLTFGTSFLFKQIGFGGASFWVGWGWEPKSWFEPTPPQKKKTCVLSKVGMYRILSSILGGCPSILTVNLVLEKLELLQIPLRTKNWLRRKLQEYPLKQMQIILGVTSEVKSEETWVGSTPHTITEANEGLTGIGDFLLEFFFVSRL